jgi:hypothetical protein
MLRYWLSLIVFFAGFCLTTLTTGSALYTFVDIPSLIIVGIFPLIFVTVLFGFKKMVSAFSIPSKKEANKEELAAGLYFFKTYGTTIWVAGLISVFIAVVGMLENLEDKMMLGPMVALALISILYSGILYMVIIIPFTVFINKKVLNG